MNNEEINRSLSDMGINNPERWHLVLQIGRSRLDYALCGDADGAFAAGTVQLASADDEAIENAIYSTPLPGNDFRSVTAIVDTRRYLYIPTELVSDDEADNETRFAQMLDMAFPSVDGVSIADTHEIECTKIKGTDASLLWGVENGLVNFLRRTFYNVNVCHALCITTEMAVRRSQVANTPRMVIVPDEDVWNVVVCDGGRLKFGNIFDANNVDDAVYYILAVWNTCNLNPTGAEVLVAGNSSLRKGVEAGLREYIKVVVPDIYPPRMFKLSKDAGKYPYNMILKLLQVCE